MINVEVLHGYIVFIMPYQFLSVDICVEHSLFALQSVESFKIEESEIGKNKNSIRKPPEKNAIVK